MKTGKTTTACKFPKALLLALETGYLTIPGVLAQPINKWSEFKQVLRQLQSAEVHEKFSNIIVDTVDLCYDLCEKYICNQNGVTKVSEIAYGQGWSMISKEFDEALRSIPQMGYGLIMISHAQDKTFTDENGNEFDRIVPTLGNRARNIVDRMTDIIGYAHPIQDEEGDITTLLEMRATPRFVAGSRFKYTPQRIVFNYDNLVNAIGDAIDKQAAEDNGKFVTNEKATARLKQPEELSFDELMSEVRNTITKIQTIVPKEAFTKEWKTKITAITDEYLGVGKKVSDCTPMQTEQLSLIADALKELIGSFDFSVYDA